MNNDSSSKFALDIAVKKRNPKKNSALFFTNSREGENRCKFMRIKNDNNSEVKTLIKILVFIFSLCCLDEGKYRISPVLKPKRLSVAIKLVSDNNVVAMPISFVVYIRATRTQKKNPLRESNPLLRIKKMEFLYKTFLLKK